jgi:hypothetical protein
MGRDHRPLRLDIVAARTPRSVVRGCELASGGGLSKIWLNGSFVTSKDTPGDFDAVWDDSGVDESGLDPVFFDLSGGRKAQKMRFGGELFPNWVNLSSDSLFSEFFQHDRTG